MTIETIRIPELAIVKINRFMTPTTVTIMLDHNYDGDLRPLEKNNALPSGVLFQGDTYASLADPLFVRFIEVLHHWDHDFDGTFDADHLVDKIEREFWYSNRSIEEFHRPDDTVFARALMRLMPPQPERHIIMGYGELKPRFKRWHYLAAIPTLIAVGGLVFLQTMLVPWLSYNPITAVGAAVHEFGFLPVLLVVCALFFAGSKLFKRQRSGTGRSSSRYTYGVLNKAAVYEEQAFREGSERWNWHQRLTSCLVFGAIHQANLFYPLATIIPLSLGGAVFMWRYNRVYRNTRFRRSAVLEAALLHRVYNRIALTIVVILLVTMISTFAIGGLVVLIPFVLRRIGIMLLGFIRQYGQPRAEYAPE